MMRMVCSANDLLPRPLRNGESIIGLILSPLEHSSPSRILQPPTPGPPIPQP